MSHVIILLLLSFIFLVFPYEISCSTCIPEERSALLQFKDSFSIEKDSFGECESPYPKTLSWRKSANNSDCCSWDGVRCDGRTGNVIELDLSCSQLKGLINSNVTNGLLQLSRLQRLNLANNYFAGSTIPSEFGRFASLTHLNLYYSGFSGLVPTEISWLSKLVSLNISINSVELDPHLFDLVMKNLTNLKELILESTIINSSIPNSLMNLSSLEVIDLSGTRLQGSLTGRIFLLPNLQALTLAGNDLTGDFPDVGLVNRTSLERLDLGYNELLGGELSASFGNLKSLKFIDISNTNLTGELPVSIGNLTFLTVLDLSITKLTGKLPESIGNLKSLLFLILMYTNLKGEIPESIGNLESLQAIVLSDTELIGKLPDSIGKLKYLRTLDLSGTKMTGELPESIGNLEYLSYFSIKGCNFTGPIPESIGNITELTKLDLSGNNIDGHIPDGLVNLFKVKEIDISENALTGPVPMNARGLRNLNTLSLGNNMINGTLPPWLFALPSLRYFNMSFNHLSGRIPDIQYASSLEFIDLSNNQLQGLIPNSIKKLVNLTSLILSSNKLNGISEPHLFSKFQNLDALDLSRNRLQGAFPVLPVSIYYFLISHNKFSGSITSAICNLVNLGILDASYNNLSGSIPECLLNSSTISVLDLKNNRFNGTITSIFADTCRFRTLNLNTNDLKGLVPQSLANCKELELLDLGNNRLNGSFPYQLESLTKLQVLVLHFNNFQGPIEMSETGKPFPALRVFDLSNNMFTDAIPAKYFHSFVPMKNVYEHRPTYMGDMHSGYEDSISLVWKGSSVDFVRILTTLTIIDWSVNRFAGEIPEAIKELNSLRFLNLSFNSLTGQIPNTMGNLVELESLDLSSNELTGVIPVTLTNIRSLAKFNVSRNRLAGQIPQGKQFDTFDNGSYIENSELCGPPLSKLCGDIIESLQPKEELEEEDDSLFSGEFTWKIVLLGYGCGVPIGIITVLLMLFFKRPSWFAAFIDKEIRRIANMFKTR